MSLKCFSCAKRDKDFYDRRKACMKRRAHRPLGEPIEHEGQWLQACADCQTLVRPV